MRRAMGNMEATMKIENKRSPRCAYPTASAVFLLASGLQMPEQVDQTGNYNPFLSVPVVYTSIVPNEFIDAFITRSHPHVTLHNAFCSPFLGLAITVVSPWSEHLISYLFEQQYHPFHFSLVFLKDIMGVAGLWDVRPPHFAFLH